MTARRAEVAQVGCKRLAQIGVATILRVAQKIDAFPCQNLRSQAFPYSYWKFVHCGNTRDKRHTCSCGRCSQIKLISDAFIWNCFCAVREANRALDGLVGFRLAGSQNVSGKRFATNVPEPDFERR